IRQANRAPARAADAQMTAVVLHADGPQQVTPLPPLKQILGVDRQFHAGKNVVGEDQESLVAVTKTISPARQTVNILLFCPVLPYTAQPAGLAARKATPLDVDHQARPAGTVDDEIEALQRRIIQDTPARLIDGDVAKALALEPALERRLVVIAP